MQLGDPITKEPLIHACLEVNSRGLVHGMKDLGGGGLSCVVGEMALSGGCGAIVHLERVPLKEEGLAPWEIWVSESQERMMIAAAKEDVKAHPRGVRSLGRRRHRDRRGGPGQRGHDL